MQVIAPSSIYLYPTAIIHAILILTAITITDGDTIRSGDLRVRLWGIDAPEMSEDGGPQAQDALRHLIGGQQLTCEAMDIDRYRRVVARCDLPDGRDVACVMVRDGHAADWPRYSGGAYRGCK